MYLADTPHAFYSPYLLSVAVVSRAVGLGPIAGLAAAGFVNLFLLLVSLKLFISSLVKEDAEKTSFYTLLFMLFLWGSPPWFWSGFLHIDVLGYVLPYPSTFSAALIFLAFAIYLRILGGARPAFFVPLFLLIPTVLLTHPTTALVLFAGLLAFTVGFRKAVTRNTLLLLAAAFAFSLLVALLYPYYSFTDLLMGKGRVFHGDAGDLYESVLPRTLPALIGIIPLLGRLRRDRRDPLVLFFVFLICIYLYGAISGSIGYGRVIFYIVLLLQLALAMRLSRAETEGRAGFAVFLIAYLYLTAPQLPMQSLRSVTQYLPGRGSNYADLLFLASLTKQHDVVLSDPQTSLMVPALGGKVVAYDRPVYWMDNRARIADAELFFSDKATAEDRLKIIREYRVGYILVDMERAGDEGRDRTPFGQFGKIAYRSPRYLLIQMDGNGV